MAALLFSSRIGLCALLFTVGCAPRVIAPPPTAAARPAPPRQYASPYIYEWFLRAELLRDRGQLAAAIEAYRAALADADEDAHVMARLATALDEHGDHAAARKLLDEALEQEPESEAAWLARAEVAQRAGDLPASFEALERAEQAEPLSPAAPLALAALLRAHGNPERASAVLLRYEARSVPGTRGAQAVRLRRALLERDPDQVFAATLPYRLGAPPGSELFDAARVLLEAGRRAQALRVIELVPETVNENGLRLRVLVACGRFAAAEAWLAQHEPASLDERIDAARVYLAQHRIQLAAHMIEADLNEQPDLPRLQLLAAQLELARAAYAHAAELFARIPAGSAVYGEALLGLSDALRGEALPELAAEVGAHATASSRTAQ